MERTKWYKNPTSIYLAIFIFSVFSGAIRKWVFGNGAVANIILGIQLFAPLAFMFCGMDRFTKIFQNKTFVIYLLVLFAEAFNPMNKTIYHGFLGILIHAGFWIGTFFYIENREQFVLEKIFPYLIGVAFLLMLLAYVQYGLPTNHILNKYVNEQLSGGVATVGTNVRVTGTFSYISGFTAYIIFHAFLVWAMVKEKTRSFVIVSLLFGGIIAAFMTGSRTATFSYAIFLAIILLYEFRHINYFKIISQLFLPLVIVVTIFSLKGNLGTFGDRIETAYANFDDRREKLEASGEQEKRLEITSILNFSGQYPIAGIGLGATYQGAVGLFGVSEHLREYGYVEAEMERYVVEGGFILLILKILITFSMCSRLLLPFFPKLFIGVMLFTFNPVVFNIYNTVFTMLGVILIDYVYYHVLLGRHKAVENT